METSPSNSPGSLDAVTYFFVNSGVFILSIAIPFFLIGLLLGRLTWGRYKRLFRQSEDVVENLKGEVSQLKRRIAEQATRPISTFSHQAAPLTLASAPMRATVFPEGEMFCVWTESDWLPPKVTPQPVRPSEAFSVWTLADFKPGLGFPPSRAFSIWTADGWEPSFTPKAALPSAKPFSVWTESGWEPIKRIHPWSNAFSIWTTPEWEPAPVKPLPAFVSSAFSVWTEPEWEPLKREHPWSCAFSLWTRPDWEPAIANPAPVGPNRAFTVWTEAGWQPIKRVHPWSQAFTKWTAPDWQPAVVAPAPAPANAAFSVWTEDGWEAPKRVHPWSHAFCLWTSDEWSPAAVQSVPLPVSSAFSLWTAPDWEPILPKPKPEPAPTETAHVPGAAPSVATIFAKAKSATSRIPLIPGETTGTGHSTQRLTPSREMIAAIAASVKPLSPAALNAPVQSEQPVEETASTPPPLDAEPPAEEAPVAPLPTSDRPQPPRAKFARPAQPVQSPPPAGGIFARFVSATKAALGLQKPEPRRISSPKPETTRLETAPTVVAMETVAATPAPSNSASVKRTPLLSGETSKVKLPKSQAFTVWTQPAWVPPTSKTSPIPRPEGLDSPSQAKEPKRQSLPKAATSAVPAPKPAQAPLPLEAAPPAPTTMAVPVSAMALATSMQNQAAAGPESEVAPSPSAENPSNRYEEMVAKLKSITPPASPTLPAHFSTQGRTHDGLPSGTIAFMSEILTGKVRNDALLGIIYRTAPDEPDDLAEMKGIAAVLENRLQDMGVYTFKQIALWTDEQAHEFSSRLGFKERVEREHWREQARALHEQKYGVKL